MWLKLKEQFPAILLTALIITGAAYWLHHQTVADMSAKQQQELAPLREQNDALKVASEENRQQIEATNKLLKDAISRREADMFRSDEEVQKMNVERMDALAEAIAKKVQPYNPLPKSPEEAEKMQNEQVDKVSARMAERPGITTSMESEGNATSEATNTDKPKVDHRAGVATSAAFIL